MLPGGILKKKKRVLPLLKFKLLKVKAYMALRDVFPVTYVCLIVLVKLDVKLSVTGNIALIELCQGGCLSIHPRVPCHTSCKERHVRPSTCKTAPVHEHTASPLETQGHSRCLRESLRCCAQTGVGL